MIVGMRAFSDNAPGWAINGRFLTQRVTGVQRYAFEILNALDAILARSSVEDNPSVRLVTPPGAHTPALAKITVCKTRLGSGHVWDQSILPIHAGARILSLGNFGPLLARQQIVCIHDANTFIMPESYSASFGLAYRTLLPLVGKRASMVATVSQFSADMLIKYGVCREDKIFIAPNGHEHVLRWDARRARTGLLDALKRPYVLLLGSAAKHKNISVVLEQAQALAEAEIEIVVAGGVSSIFAADTPALRRPNVHYLGFVDDDDLAALYQSALCLAFPSKIEGFGIPMLEAMAFGCPVICSDVASLGEVGGEATLYVKPEAGDLWREAIIGLSKNEGLRASLAAKGRKQATLFTWNGSAERYLHEMKRLAPGWKVR